MFTRKALFTATGSCVLAAAAALQVPAASAVPINITAITGSWTGASPAGVSGIGTNQISWGTPVPFGGPQSSYLFDPAAVPVNGILPETDFQLGEFTHNNFPISANGVLLDSAKLTINFTFDILDGINVIDTEMISSVFDFSHNETPNNFNPCFDGNPNGVAPNQNGCADQVTFATNPSSETFVGADGLTYEFQLTGFTTGGMSVTEFFTVENESNTAVLNAVYAVREPMPLPGIAWLFAAGLAGVGASRRLGGRKADAR